MTFEERLNELLVEHGMWPGQAQAIVDRVKAAKRNESMEGRWDDQIEDYPPQMLAVLWMSVRTEALVYIDENCPQAWFRPMFTPKTA